VAHTHDRYEPQICVLGRAREYRQVPDNVARTQELLGLTAVEAELLPELDDGVALWKVANRSFLVQHQLSSIEIPLVDTDRRMIDRAGRWDQ
jgi:hypothetical protein